MALETLNPPTEKEVIKPAKAPEPGAAAANLLSEQWVGRKKTPAEIAPVTTEEPAKEKEEKKEPPDAKPAPKPKPKAKAIAPMSEPPEPVKEPDYEKITEAVAKGMGKAAPVSTEEELPLHEKERIEVLERMEKDYPDLYKGKVAANLAAIKYKDKWEKENPDKEFDPDADEHDAFFDKNDVEYNELHFARTVARMEAERATAKGSEKTNEEIKELKAKEQLREAAPKIVQHQVTAARQYFAKLGDEYSKVLDDNGNINSAEIARLNDSDPVKAIALNAATTVEIVTGEMYRLINGYSEYNDKSPLHADISKFVDETEVALKRLPAEQQLDGEGRRFATGEEYSKLAPDKRKYYWRLTEERLSEIYAADMAIRVQKTIETEEKKLAAVAKARGWKKAETQNGESEPLSSGENSEAAEPEKKSPAGIVEPRIADVSGSKRAGASSKASAFTSRWVG